MSEILKIVLSLSFSGSLFILVLFLCKPLYKSNLSKRWQYYIWLVVIARLLLPLAAQASPVGALFQETDWVTVRIDTPPGQDEALAPRPGTSTAITDNSNQQNADTRPGAVLTAQKTAAIFCQNLWLFWLVVALITLIRKITIYQGFVRYIKAGRTEVSDTELLDQLAHIGEQAGVKKPIELYTNGLISSPLLLGFFRPCIVLPTTDMPNTDFYYTVLHELAHYKRRDMFYKWLIQVTICLHWFNPLVYAMGREVGRACELACDEAVMHKLDATGRQAYGDALLNAVDARGGYHNSLASVTLSESGVLLKERLCAIMSFKKKSILSVSVSMLFTVVLCISASAAGAYAASPSVHYQVSQSGRQDVIPSITGIGEGKTDASSYVIECSSEKIIVKQGGMIVI